MNTQKNVNYEFLISPGVSDTTRLMELFPMYSKTDRLMLVQMTERQTYHVKLMLIILSHEIAHCVGRQVRMREQREKQIVYMCSRMICKSMKCYIFGKDEEHVWVEVPEHWKELEDKVEYWIARYVNRDIRNENYWRDKYKQEEKTENEKNTDTLEKKETEALEKECNNRTDVLEKILNNVIEELLLSKGEVLFRFVIWDRFEKERKEDKSLEWKTYYDENKEIIQTYINEYLGERMNEDDSLNISTSIQTILYLLKECYADVICILSLRLSVKDYLEAIKENISVSKWNVEDVENTVLIPRIALVMQAVHYPLNLNNKEKEYYRWTDEEFNYSVEKELEIYQLESMARQFTANYMISQEERDYIEESGSSVVYDRIILIEILKYLKNCQELFYELFNCERLSEIDNMKQNDKEKLDINKLNYVRQFYDLTKESNGNVVFEKYMELLKAYEKDVYKDMEELIKLDSMSK